MKYGFLKAAAGVPAIRLADCRSNAEAAVQLMQEAHKKGVRLLALPELTLTGATCGDLFLQEALIRGAEQALDRVREASLLLKGLITVVGLPFRFEGRLYNAAAVVYEGKVLGIVPKQHLGLTEDRHFSRGPAAPAMVSLFGAETPFGGNLIFTMKDCPGYRFSVVLGEDMSAPFAPAAFHAAAGASLIVGLMADPAAAGRPAVRRSVITSESRRLLVSYLTVNAGAGESSTDHAFSGHSIAAECGDLLAESVPFEEGLTVTEFDLERASTLRRKTGLFSVDAEAHREILFEGELEDTVLTRPVSPFPFVPQEKEACSKRMEEILTIQAEALARRLSHIGCKTAVLGISGGLDSTLALMVIVRAMRLLGRPNTDILAVTMPCFGTTKRTKSNAEKLCTLLGVTFKTIDITPAVRQHFADIGQDVNTPDTTFENGQARERTQVLMDLANRTNGIVVGTGDLSELALGWATYNGDHMSMYGVNATVPKTLVRALVRHEAEHSGNREIAAVLLDVVATPVSPELLPAKDGETEQLTENKVGPYELNDFYLYYMLRYGYSPAKILKLALHAFGNRYDRATILGWLRNFSRRFFQQQFKRSCLPDGPATGPVGLSPRGTWEMPSDVLSSLWLNEIDELMKKE